MVETFSFNGLNILIENGGIQRREKKNINKLKKYEEINELIIRKWLSFNWIGFKWSKNKKLKINIIKIKKFYNIYVHIFCFWVNRLVLCIIDCYFIVYIDFIISNDRF